MDLCYNKVLMSSFKDEMTKKGGSATPRNEGTFPDENPISREILPS